jgi:hypothetical protein
MNNLTIPKNYDSVLVDQFIALRKLDEDNSSFFIKQIEILSILTDTLPDDEIWEDMDVEELSNITKELNWLRIEPSNDFKKKIDKYTCIDINQLTFGAFLDIEAYVNENYIKNIMNICAVLYRQTRLDDWGNLEIEPYSNINIEERAKIFEELYITDIYGIVKYYLEFKDLVTTAYNTLFEPNIPEEEIEEVIEYDAEELADIEAEKIQTKWAWERILYEFADGDITKYDTILSLPVIFIFNQMAFKKEMKL